MMPTDRFERQLPVLLTELAEPRTPDYLDDLLVLTARTRQRPAWTFLERWIPMVDIARQPVIAPGIPWRSIGLGFLLVGLLLAAVAAFVVGTRPNLPPPFGPARNGLVAYATDGDIYAVDPVTGAATAVVTGPETDLDPQWSLDGTRFAFERMVQGDSGPGLLYVARADGTDLTLMTPKPLAVIEGYAFSPDGLEILLSASPRGIPTIFIANSDGSGICELDVGMPATEPAWRPPDGAQIMFNSVGNIESGYNGLHAVNPDSGEVRTIIEPSIGRYRAQARWSPDGSQIVYYEWASSANITARTHIISADGTGDRMLAIPPDAMWDAAQAWSNDGTRLIAIRGYTGGYEDVRAAVVPVDGSGLGIEVEYPGNINGECCSSWEWAPDDLSILGTPSDGAGRPLPQVLLDPVAGTSNTVPWTTVSHPTWQRLAP